MPSAICVMQPILPAAMMSAPVVAIFAILRSRSRAASNVGLNDIVGAGGAAAQMSFGDIFHHEATSGEQVAGFPMDTLTMLQRTGGVKRNGEIGRRDRRHDAELGQIFRYVARET